MKPYRLCLNLVLAVVLLASCASLVNAAAVLIEFKTTDGQKISGEVVGHDLSGFELDAKSGGPKHYKWDQLRPQDVLGIHEKLIKAKDGPGWMDVGYLLESMRGASPLEEKQAAADVAFERAIALDPTFKDRVDTVHTKRQAAKAALQVSAGVQGQPAEATPGTPSDDAALSKDGDSTSLDAELNPKGMSRFVVSLCEDKQGNLWVGTEDTGVWRYDPYAPVGQRWTQFTRESTGGPRETSGPVLTTGTPAENALGDDFAYALACDNLGRIWVGHLNHGVSVYDGRTPEKDEKGHFQGWRNYDVRSGPLGERVFDIATCPETAPAGAGDVWIATNAGLTRYSVENDEWTYVTRADGLPSDQIQSLAFAKDGTLYAGTQCDGIAIGEPDGKGLYPHWLHITAPSGFGEGQLHPIPLTPSGTGLPSNLINDILVASDASVYVATTAGLAVSRDEGRSWTYVRGEDWYEKIKGLNSRKPSQTAQSASRSSRTLLLEDYCTSLAEEPQTGNLWIGHRREGYELLNKRTGIRAQRSTMIRNATDYAFTMLARDPRSGPPLVGFYGGGLIPANPTHGSRGNISADKSAPSLMGARHPSPAKPPNGQDLHAMLARLQALISEGAKVESFAAAVLAEDWVTQGDWVGRYGRQYAILCAADAPLDQHIHMGDSYFQVQPFIGPNCPPSEALRRWVHWVKTSDIRSLYSPINGTRRQAEWDDRGEGYPPTRDGPDLWYMLTIKNPGTYRLSMYFFNKDGHSGNNRFRDYVVEVRPYPQHWPKDMDWREMAARTAQPGLPVLARTRVRDFWGGVHKQLLLKGADTYLINIKRNYSFNTILSSVMVDRLSGPSTSHDTMGLAMMSNVPYNAAPLPASPPDQSWGALCHFLDENWNQRSLLTLQHVGRILAYRAVVSGSTDPKLAQVISWRLGIWNSAQRQEHHRVMKIAWDRLVAQNPQLAQPEAMKTPHPFPR